MVKKNHIIIGIFLLLAGGVVFNIADPFTQTDQPPELNFSESPEEIVTNSTLQLERVSHTRRVYVINNSSTQNRSLYLSLSVNPSERKYYAKYHKTMSMYGNAVTGWTKDSNADSWAMSKTYAKYPTDQNDTSFQIWNTSNIAAPDTNVSRVSENETTLVLRLSGEDKSVIPFSVGGNVEEGTVYNATLYIDKKEEHISKIYSVTNTSKISAFEARDKNNFVRTHYIGNFGETEVERPEEIDFSLTELLWDVLN